jgi:hypothetical protein
VRDHQLIAVGHLGHGLEAIRMLARWFSGHRLPALQQRVAAQGDHDSHRCARLSWTAGRHQDRLDGVHAVLGLVEGDVGRLSNTSSVTSIPFFRSGYCSAICLPTLVSGCGRPAGSA